MSESPTVPFAVRVAVGAGIGAAAAWIGIASGSFLFGAAALALYYVGLLFGDMTARSGKCETTTQT